MNESYNPILEQLNLSNTYFIYQYPFSTGVTQVHSTAFSYISDLRLRNPQHKNHFARSMSQSIEAYAKVLYKIIETQRIDIKTFTTLLTSIVKGFYLFEDKYLIIVDAYIGQLMTETTSHLVDQFDVDKIYAFLSNDMNDEINLYGILLQFIALQTLPDGSNSYNPTYTQNHVKEICEFYLNTTLIVNAFNAKDFKTFLNNILQSLSVIADIRTIIKINSMLLYDKPTPLNIVLIHTTGHMRIIDNFLKEGIPPANQ